MVLGEAHASRKKRDVIGHVGGWRRRPSANVRAMRGRGARGPQAPEERTRLSDLDAEKPTFPHRVNKDVDLAL
jgi:hypothetical protein